jgi:NAD(P)-dependent dehydrogenase (short-subunit alcohol dehydrogenase family)
MRTSLLFLLLLGSFCHASGFADSKATQTIVVTCASGELGAATAKLLARQYNLILTGRNLSKLTELQKQLQAENSGQYEICQLDYTDAHSIAEFKNQLELRATPLAGFVLITPRPQFYGKAVIQEEKAWLEVFQATFTGPLEALKIALSHMQKPSKIVIIAGSSSVQLHPESGPTCVIRRMWTTYTKALSHQLGPQGISINALSPGVVLTDFHETRIKNKAAENGISYDEQMQREVTAIPLQRHAKPEEVANTIAFLLSAESNFITGANLVLDGGLTVSY